MQEVLTGQLLVASSLVTQPVYRGGVCLLVHEQDDEVIGVMLNRPIRPEEGTVNAITEAEPNGGIEGASDQDSVPGHMLTGPGNRLPLNPPLLQKPIFTGEISKMLHFGGPQSGPVVAVHQNEKLAEAEMGQGVYVAAQKHHLEDLVRHPSHPYRLIVGHIRWSRAQLDQELASGVWHRLPATRQTVFGTSDEMWHRMIRRATTRSMADWMGTPDVPNAYELN